MIKDSIILLLSFLFVALCSSALCAETSERWKIGHLRPSNSAIDKDLHLFTEQISTKTNNKILFDVYPGNRLGDYSVVQERVSFGEVELYVGPIATSIDRRLILATTPYLVNSWAEAQKMYSQGSELLETIAKILVDQNIKLLGGWPVYFGGIALTEQPPHPGDPDVSKKMIIRVPPIRSFELTARQLGYTPYPITWTYAKMGLKTGMVSGIIGGGAEGYAGLKELVKYYIPVKDHFEYWFVYMNMDKWNGLSEQEKELFLTTVKEMETRRYAVAESLEKESILKLKEQGTKIIELSETELTAMRKKVQQNVWPVLEKEIGPEFGRIVSTVKNTQ
ncbi:MAG: C4-dicarboxylate ABC transporter [Desulforhopalus sp.]|nr:C4-dicarboxylate ABC transporter [Desulforhopalus sp.]